MTANLEAKLLKRKQTGNLRQLSIKHDLIDFASNDYLGLARSHRLSAAIFEELDKQRDHGSTGSRLLTGNSAYAQQLEECIATFHGHEAGVLFNCGYMANVGLLSTIAQSNNVIFYDAQVHASIHDGMRLGRAKCFPFRHNDLNHLEHRLKQNQCHEERFICVESLYSTDGSMAPISNLVQLAEKYQAHLIVDEAHAIGVFGPQGRGLVAEHRLTNRIFAQIVTFGKALGTFGAIVLGSNLLKQALINFATAYIYTTALPLHNLAAIKCSYDLFPNLEKERQHIHSLIALGQQGCTHIQAVKVVGNEAVRDLARKAQEKGFSVSALMSPTVQQGYECLRICLHAHNTCDDLKQLSNALH